MILIVEIPLSVDDYSFIGRNLGDPALKDRSHNCTTEGDRLNRFSVSLLAKAATRLHFVFAFVLTTKREDPATVREAWNGSQTVVTANEDDFIRYTLKH